MLWSRQRLQATGKHKNSVNSTEQTFSETLGPRVHLPSGAGWCEAKKKVFSQTPSVFYIFSKRFHVIEVSISLDAWQSPAETTSLLTAVFSLLGHQWVYSWKLPRVFQPQVILHHSVFLWTAPQMQVKTETGSWHAYMDDDCRKPASWRCSGTCVPSLPSFWNSVNVYC